ncbi:MAG: DUF3971 domain-containing protein, partial [Pseudomonadota bacterium]
MTSSSSERRRDRVGRGVRRAAQASRSAFLWFVFFTICLLALLLSAARWWLPSYVERNQTSLVQTIGDNMGVPLQADNTALQWSQWGPSLQLSGLHVELPGIDRPLTLDHVEASLDLRQLVQFRKLIIDEVTLRGLAMEIGRAADGTWLLALDRQPSESSGTGLQNVVAALSRFGWINVEEASLLLRDDASNDVYAIDNIQIVANNTDTQTRFSVEADLPDTLGGHLRAVGTLSADVREGFSGQTYANLDRLKLGALASVLNTQGAQPDGDVTDVQLWSQFDAGQLSALQYQVAGDSIELKDEQQQRQWYLDYFNVTGGWDRVDSGWRTWIDDTVFARDGVAWRPGLTTLVSNENGYLASGELLRIEDVVGLIQPWRDLPAVSAAAQWVENSAPQGDVALWKVRVPHASAAPQNPAPEPADDNAANDTLATLTRTVQFEAVINDWSNQRFGDIPGAENLNAAVRLDQGRFSVRLEGESAVVDAPTLFRVPLQLDRVAAQFDGSLTDGDQWLVSDDVLIETPHFKMLTQVSVAPSADQRGLDLDVRGSIRDLDGRYLSNYYPIGALPTRLQAWLERSLQGGRLPRGEFLVLGNTADYPFRDKQGRVDVRLEVEDLGMQYHTRWPALSEMNGTFRLDGIGTYFEGEAKVLDGTLRNVDARIPDVRAARMEIDSSWIGDSGTLVSWLRTGPLSKAVGRYFRDVEVAGPVVLQIAPEFGLRPKMPASVEGVAQFTDATLVLKGPDLTFEHVKGRVPFNQRGMLGHELEGEYQDSPIQVVVSPTEDQSRFTIEALTDVDLGRWLYEREVPVADWVDGRSRWDVTVDLQPGRSGGPTRVAIDAVSDLRGVQVTAPDPVAKDASIARQLRVNATIGGAETDRWQVDYGEDVTVAFASRQGKLESMSIGAGLAAPTLPESGVRARVEWPSADVERWYTVLERCCFSGDGGEERASVDIFARIAQAQWLGAPIGEMTLQLAEDNRAVVGQVSGDVVDGRFQYAGGDTPRLQADLTRLDVSLLMDGEYEISEAEPTHPRDYPAVDVNLRELIVDNLRFTDIHIQTQPTASGLEIVELVARSPLYTAQVAGRWDQSESGDDISHIELFAHSNDVGLAVADMGSIGTLSGGQGQFSMAGSWRDALWSPDLETLSGGMSLDLKDGRVNGLDPGAGRVFGLLALQTLPQRLALDFSDLGDGLGYEVIRGEFELGEGNHSGTRNGLDQCC